MSTYVDPMPVTVLVDLVNGWGTAPRREAGEEALPYPAAETVDRLRLPGTELPDQDLLVQLADRLHPVFATGDPAERCALVDALLDATGVRPTVVADPLPRQGWRVEDPGAAPLAAAALTLRALVGGAGGDRLGTCAGDRCADAYVDASPAGRRRFCSVTCQNRARVAAYRRRHAGARNG